MSGPRVLVVGGGLSGLAAAWRLRRRGCPVQVLEGRARVGGRATSDERDGYLLDSGPHVVGARDRRLLSLVEESGLAREILPLRPTRLGQVHHGRVHPIDPADWRGLAAIPGLRLWDALRSRRLGRLERRFRSILDPAAPERAMRLDDRSAADFARLYFGRSALDRWVAPLLASEGQADAEEASRLLFWLQNRAHGAPPLGALRGSLARLAEGLHEPGEDRLESDAVAVEPGPGGATLSVHPSSGDALEADAVVLAIPAAAARTVAAPMLTSAEDDVLGRARCAAAIVLCAALERPLENEATRLRVPPAEGWPVTTIALEPGGAGGRAPEGCSLALLVTGDAWSLAQMDAADEVVEKELVGFLQRLYPGAASAIRFCALRRHRAAMPHFDVGRYRDIARLRAVERDRREAGRHLYLAGDHLVAPSLEGAVSSGLRAAEALLEDFGVGGDGSAAGGGC